MKWQRLPYITLIISLIVVIVQSVPAAQSLLIYDRVAIFHGEWWRVFTSTLTHHSAEHLFWNLVVLGLFGCLLEFNRRPVLLKLLLLTAAGHILFLYEPKISFFAGMSGYVTSIIFYLCLERMNSDRKSKSIWTLLLMLLVAKAIYELVSPKSLFTAGNFLLLPQAHILGIGSALLLYLASYKEHSSARSMLPIPPV